MGVTGADNTELYYPVTGTADYDFIRFSFNGVTSQSLGISRVSEGSRYTEQMLPNFSDKTAQMPGSDYTLYWESFYNTRTWNLNIAFDHMIESQMREFRKTFNTKVLSELSFEERPGIHWLAKVQSPPQLKYICFNENGENIYKGEGTINFIAYYPFGMSNIYRKTNVDGSVIITNEGDIPMDWFVILSKAQAKLLEQIKIEITAADGGATLSSKIITFNKAGLNSGIKSNDTHIIINSKTNLIEGASSYTSASGAYTPTGNVYNQYISSGDFFQIPVSEQDKVLTFFITGPTGTVRNLYYRYLYL